jgi:hypothetical protein
MRGRGVDLAEGAQHAEPGHHSGWLMAGEKGPQRVYSASAEVMLKSGTGKEATPAGTDAARREGRLGFRRNIAGEVIVMVGVDEVLDEAVRLRVGLVRRPQGLGSAQCCHLLCQLRNVLGDLVQQFSVEPDHLGLAVADGAGHELQRLAQALLAALELGRLPAVRQLDQER